MLWGMNKKPPDMNKKGKSKGLGVKLGLGLGNRLALGVRLGSE